MVPHIIRKRHDPPVEAWIEEGREIHKESKENEDGEDIQELWKWAGDWTSERIAKYAQEEASEEYTAEEVAMGIDNVRTGLREVYESDDDESEDVVMEDVEVGDTTVARPAVVRVEFGVGEIKKGRPEGELSMREMTKIAGGGRKVGT